MQEEMTREGTGAEGKNSVLCPIHSLTFSGAMSSPTGSLMISGRPDHRLILFIVLPSDEKYFLVIPVLPRDNEEEAQ